jgi:hypothetical protein
VIPLPEILAKLSRRTLDEIARVVGPVPGLAPSATRAETERALFHHYAGFRAPIHIVWTIADMFDVQAAAAVFAILPRIASDEGRRGALECARNWGDPRAETWASWSAIDVAAALAIEVATTMDVPEKTDQYQRAKCLVTAARRRVDAAPTERPTYELAAVSPVALDAGAIEAVLRRDLGVDVVEVWSAVDAADGSLLVAVFVKRSMVALPVLRKSGRIGVDRYRPVTVDSLRISADGSRVSLTLDGRHLLRTYAKALGLSLRASVTLRRIRPDTFDALRARAPAGMKINVDRLGFRFADGTEYIVEGVDPWKEATRLWAEGALRSVRFRVEDEHGRVFRVFLERPHRIEIPELMTYPLARALIAKLRLLRGARPAEKAERVKTAKTGREGTGGGRGPRSSEKTRALRARVVH